MRIRTRTSAFQSTFKFFSFFYILFGVIINCVTVVLEDNNYTNIVFISIQILFTFTIEAIYINSKVANKKELKYIDINNRKYFYINDETSKIEINVLKKYCSIFIVALTTIYFICSLVTDKKASKKLSNYKIYNFLKETFGLPMSGKTALILIVMTIIGLIIVFILINAYICPNYYQKYYNLQFSKRNLLNKEKAAKFKKQRFSNLLYYSNKYDMNYSFLLDRKELYENKCKKIENKIRKNNDKSEKYLKKIKLIYLAKYE